MLTNRNIAFFIDLYNTELDSQHYTNIVEQISQMGQIISGTIYGATERTHKDVLADADERGYNVVRSARKRGRKTFDLRIIVDVVNKINNSRGIDAVCIVAQPADLLYLYAFLRERGIKIIALSNGEEKSMALVDEVIDSGKVETIKLPKPTRKKVAPVVEQPVVEPVVVAEPEPVAPVEEPIVEEPAQPIAEEPAIVEEPSVSGDLSRMDELLREIDRLRSEVEQTSGATTPVPEEPVVEQAVEEPVAEEPIVEEPTVVEEPAVVEEPVAEEPAQPIAQEPIVEEPVAPAEQPSQPRATYVSTDNADLIHKIEQLRQSGAGDDSLIDEIKKLLDDID